jgi:hypothetical protein
MLTENRTGAGQLRLARHDMLTDEQVKILADVSQSIAFADDEQGRMEALIIGEYVRKDGDVYELTPKGVTALEEHTSLALQQKEDI